MMKIALHGYAGHMGRVVEQLVQDLLDAEIACGVDAVQAPAAYPTFTSLDEIDVPFDVIIDFSVAVAVDALLSFTEKTGKPLVLCTTGLTDAQKEQVNAVSKVAPVFFSANMSLGVNLLTALAVKAAQILSPAGFDIEIEERHHRRKLDAPSGTALMIGEALTASLGEDFILDTGRMDRRAARDPKTIGLSAIRGGTIVGEHSVIFAGHDEVIELKHSAGSREIFAIGAVNAAKFLLNQPAGLYDMSDLLNV